MQALEPSIFHGNKNYQFFPLKWQTFPSFQENSQPQAQHWIAFVSLVSHALKRHGIAWGRGPAQFKPLLLGSFGSLKELVLPSPLFITVNTNEAYS